MGVWEWSAWGRTGTNPKNVPLGFIRSLLLKMGPLRSRPGASQEACPKDTQLEHLSTGFCPWGGELPPITTIRNKSILRKHTEQPSAILEKALREIWGMFWRPGPGGTVRSWKLWLKVAGGTGDGKQAFQMSVLQTVLPDNIWQQASRRWKLLQTECVCLLKTHMLQSQPQMWQH